MVRRWCCMFTEGRQTVEDEGHYSDEDIRLSKSDGEESEESTDVIDNIPVKPDMYVCRWGWHRLDTA
ncbi:hypothetical protein TNCV_1631661 [Trichonephila clavipes]|nr:hypothetical protein TNCV_1631661 [Trichonephila clavipes]